MQAYFPNKQIALAVGRTLLTAQSRWVWVALACVNGLIIIGGGFALGGSLREFLQAAAGLMVASLQFLWIWFALKLLALNHPTTARLVPHYVKRLRVTALWIWASIVAATALLVGETGLGFVWAAVGSAILMVFLTAPFRWPVRWSICTFLVFPFLARQADYILNEILPLVKSWSLPLALGFLMLNAVVVFFLFHRNGSNYAKIFSRSSAGAGAMPKGVSLEAPKLSDFGAWGIRAAQLGQWLTLPATIYARKLLRSPAAADRPYMARVELGVGISPHWVTQIQIAFALILCMLIAPAANALLLADFVAGSLLFIALLPSAAMPQVFRKTTVEQKLLILLPGMARGNALTQQLAKRQTLRAYASWGVAAAIAFWLPLEGTKFLIVASGYLTILILIPMIPTTNWARLRPANAESGLLELVILAALGGTIYAAQRWGHVSTPTLFVAAVVCSFALLSWRWSRVKRYQQAFPVGHLLTKQSRS